MNIPSGLDTNAEGRRVPTSQIEWVSETLILMLANGAKLPLVVAEDDCGRLVIQEMSRRHISWPPSDWGPERAGLVGKLMDAWGSLHTAAAGDPESDPDSIQELFSARDRFTDAANDFCTEMDKCK